MANKRLAKKRKKQLFQDYQVILSPITKQKRVYITESINHFEQSFEIFSLYKNTAGTFTSNNTTSITNANIQFLNA